MIVHHSNCSASYPEKPANEPPQAVAEFKIDHGESVRQCIDCGAFEVVDALGNPATPRSYYEVDIYKAGRLYDFQVYRADEISITTFVREVLSHGYGLDIRLEEA